MGHLAVGPMLPALVRHEGASRSDLVPAARRPEGVSRDPQGIALRLPSSPVWRLRRGVLVRNPIGPTFSCLRRTVRERDSRWRRGRL
jgi:hypothetical protein